MQIEKLILSIPERWCNISRSHPKNYFLVFGAIFKWNLLKNCNLQPQHIYKDKIYWEIILKHAFQI